MRQSLIQLFKETAIGVALWLAWGLVCLIVVYFMYQAS